MKNTIIGMILGIGIAILIVCLTGATHVNQTPINGFLQSDLDANSLSINGLTGIAFSSSTNFITFGATNPAPAVTTPVLWVSVRLANDTNAYVLPLSIRP